MKNDAVWLIEEAQRVLGDPETWPQPVEFYDSLALCAINSVYSLNNNSGAGRNVLRRYRDHRRFAGFNPEQDNGSDLLLSIAAAGGPKDFAEDIVDNRSRLGNTGRLKTEGLQEGVQRLVDVGVNTTSDLRQATPERLKKLSKEWQKTRGLGPESWRFLTMNAGLDNFKVDRMLRRFYERATNSTPDETPAHHIRGVYVEAARQLNVPQRNLDYAVWSYESPYG